MSRPPIHQSVNFLSFNHVNGAQFVKSSASCRTYFRKGLGRRQISLLSKLSRGRFCDTPCAGANGPCQSHAVVKSPSPLKLFVFCPLRADRFVGSDTSSRSCIARYVGTPMLGLKSDTVFRIELACLGPRLASAELIRARRRQNLREI